LDEAKFGTKARYRINLIIFMLMLITRYKTDVVANQFLRVFT